MAERWPLSKGWRELKNDLDQIFPSMFGRIVQDIRACWRALNSERDFMSLYQGEFSKPLFPALG